MQFFRRINKKGIGGWLPGLVAGFFIFLMMIIMFFYSVFGGYNLNEKIKSESADFGLDGEVIGFLNSEDNSNLIADKIVSGCSEGAINIDKFILQGIKFSLKVECDGKSYQLKDVYCSKKEGEIKLPSLNDEVILVRYCA